MNFKSIDIRRVPIGHGFFYDDLTTSQVEGISPITANVPYPFTFWYGDMVLPNNHFASSSEYAVYNTIHEIGHIWDIRENLELTAGLMRRTGTILVESDFEWCLGVWDFMSPIVGNYMCGKGFWNPDGKIEYFPGHPTKPYGGGFNNGIFTDEWAETFATYIYPEYYSSKPGYNLIGPIREHYVKEMIANIK